MGDIVRPWEASSRSGDVENGVCACVCVCPCVRVCACVYDGFERTNMPSKHTTCTHKKTIAIARPRAAAAARRRRRRRGRACDALGDARAV